jgi:hypothetical protein
MEGGDMKGRTWLLVVLLPLTCLVGKAAVTITVDVEGSLLDASGQPLADGNQVRIGYFAPGFNIGPDLQKLNLSDLVTHFNTFDSVATTTIFRVLPGRFIVYDQGRDVSQPPASAFPGQQIYILAFKTDNLGSDKSPNATFSDVTQFGLFTNPTWAFPNPNVALGTVVINANALDLNTQSLWPVPSSIVGGVLQLAPVPEPAAYGSAAFGVLLLFAGRNRWRAKRSHTS